MLRLDEEFPPEVGRQQDAELDRRRAAQDLADRRRRSRGRILGAVVSVGVVALVVLGFRALLKESPCIDLLEEATSVRLDKTEWERDDHLRPGVCYVTLKARDRKPKLRIFANVGSHIVEDSARQGLIVRGFERFVPLGLGDEGFLAVAPEDPATREMELTELPAWLTTQGGTKPSMHVAVFQKDEVIVTVELDANTFDPDEAESLVESMKPALGELRRLGRL